MMNAGTNIRQRAVILVPFPFSDLSTAKKRPALVVSNNNFNKNNEDVICCSITSNLKDAQPGIHITNNEMETGVLKFESKIKPYRLFTVSKNIIYKILGRLKVDKSVEVIEEIKKLVEIKLQDKE